MKKIVILTILSTLAVLQVQTYEKWVNHPTDVPCKNHGRSGSVSGCEAVCCHPYGCTAEDGTKTPPKGYPECGYNGFCHCSRRVRF